MNRQARACCASLALHAAGLLVVSGLGGAVGAAWGPRVIDLSILQPSGDRIAALPSPPEPTARSVRQHPSRQPQAPAAPAPEPLSQSPDPAPTAATLPAVAEAAHAAAVVPAAPAAQPQLQDSGQEDAVPIPVSAVPAGPAASGSAETTESASSPDDRSAAASGGDSPPAAAAPGTSAAVAAAAPLPTPSGGPAGGGNAGVPRDVAALRAIIQRHLVYPGVARRKGWEGKVLLSFIICGNGRAREVTVLESSGRDLLDRHALQTVAMITDFPASAAEARVILPVVYRLY